jgi:DNA-binding transcriptional ArsR family regulator
MVAPFVVDAFAHPVRLTILLHCEDRPRGVAEIAEELGISHSSLRRHLDVLLRAEILHDGPRGFHAGVGWSRVRDELEKIARRHADLSASGR